MPQYHDFFVGFVLPKFVWSGSSEKSSSDISWMLFSELPAFTFWTIDFLPAAPTVGAMVEFLRLCYGVSNCAFSFLSLARSATESISISTDSLFTYFSESKSTLASAPSSAPFVVSSFGCLFSLVAPTFSLSSVIEIPTLSYDSRIFCRSGTPVSLALYLKLASDFMDFISVSSISRALCWPGNSKSICSTSRVFVLSFLFSVVLFA